MNRDHITVRPATAADLPAIHDLVMELAIYEKAPHEMVATLEDYRRDWAAGWFGCHVAESYGEVLGMILYYDTYSTWKGRMLYLEDFVVKASHRRQGIGQRLFEQLYAVARAKECRLIKWQVLDWNTPAIEFYKQYQATIETEWYNCKVFL